MSGSLEIPRIAELLGPVLGEVPQTELPALLASLERGAAARYREWAGEAEVAAQREALLACAAREEEIAAKVEKLFPVNRSSAERIEALLPEAKRLYLSVFDAHPMRDQWRIQASAEREGAATWRALAKGQADPTVQAELRGCAELEETSAACLDSLLAG